MMMLPRQGHLTTPSGSGSECAVGYKPDRTKPGNSSSGRKSNSLMPVSGRCHQESDQGFQQCLTSNPCVMHELEEAQVKGQLLLRDPPVGTQLRSQYRPESLPRVDVDLAE